METFTQRACPPLANLLCQGLFFFFPIFFLFLPFLMCLLQASTYHCPSRDCMSQNKFQRASLPIPQCTDLHKPPHRQSPLCLVCSCCLSSARLCSSAGLDQPPATFQRCPLPILMPLATDIPGSRLCKGMGQLSPTSSALGDEATGGMGMNGPWVLTAECTLTDMGVFHHKARKKQHKAGKTVAKYPVFKNNCERQEMQS